jgi:hypothetical protein
MVWLIGIMAVLATAAASVAAVAGSGASAAPKQPAGKLARMEAAQYRLRQEKAADRTKPSYAAGLREAEAANRPAPARHAGIMRLTEGPFSAGVFTVKDAYQGPADGTWLLAYAGARVNVSTGAPAGGALAIYSQRNASDLLRLVGTFDAPSITGPLTITGVHGDILTVKTQAGAVLTFNLKTDTYGG